jgi:hypothetical protein
MKSFKSFAKVSFFLVLMSPAMAQLPAEDDIDFIYLRSWDIGASISTVGWNVFGSYNKIINPKTSIGTRSSIGILKTQNEVKQAAASNEFGKNYVFGKINAAAIGRQYLIVQKQLVPSKRENGVEISYILGAGPNWTYLKPIYHYISEGAVGHQGELHVEELRYDPLYHSKSNLHGRSSHNLGRKEGVSYLGGSFIAALSFDASAESNRIIAFEMGSTIDQYKNSLPLYYYGENKSTFVSVYLAIRLGIKKLQ